jgi:hypothetical protein
MTDPIAKMRGEAVFQLVHKILLEEAWRVRSFEESMIRLGLKPSRNRRDAYQGLEAASAIVLHLIATGQDMRLDGGQKPPWVKTAHDEDRWRTQIKTIREILADLAGQARNALSPKTGEDDAASADSGASQDSAPTDQV